MEVNAFTLAQLMYYGRLGKTKDYVVFKEVYHQDMSTKFVDTFHSIFETHGYIQMLLNGSRLGFYEPIRRTVNSVLGFTPTDQIAYTSVIAGAASGVVGGKNLRVLRRPDAKGSIASLGNPMYLIKARMQVKLS